MRLINSWRTVSLLLLLGSALRSLRAGAQLNQGSLLGHVTDGTGAVIAKAEITVRNIDTGVVVKGLSSEVGEFQFPALPLGTYDVSVSMPGFKTARFSRVLVELNTAATLNAVPQVGGTSDTVTIDASAPSLQTESSDIGGVVTKKQVIDFLSYIVGGWQPGAILRYQSGTPISFGCAASIPGWDNCIRYSQLSGSSLESAAAKAHQVNPFNVPTAGANPAINSIFNLTTTRDPVNGAFVDPNAARGSGAYQFGNLPRVESVYRINPYYNEDFSIIKDFPVHESMGLQLKLELLNAFNRHAFALPDVTPSDTLFGVPTNTLTTPRNVQITARFLY